MYRRINKYTVAGLLYLDGSIHTQQCPSRRVESLARSESHGSAAANEKKKKKKKTPDRQVGPNDEWTSRRAIIYNRRPVDIFSHTHTYTHGG
jgi:hypothetical protein